MSPSHLLHAAAFSFVALALPSLAGAQSRAGTGDHPVYGFRAEPLNALGVQSLADLRGRPVLVDFWGTQCPPCVGFAVPSALKLAAQYGDDLAVIFVEVQNTGPDAVASFALRQRWFGTDAMWTSERPFSLGLQGIPQSALLSPDGEILLAGYTSEIHRELEERIAELVTASKQAPAGSPSSLEKAWKEFGKGKYARALEDARSIAGDETHEDAASARAAVEEMVRRIDLRLERIARYVEHGRLVRALAQLDELGAVLEGESELVARITALRARAVADERELEADRALSQLEERLYDDGPNARHERALERLAEKYAGTRSGERAAKLAALAASA